MIDKERSRSCSTEHSRSQAMQNISACIFSSVSASTWPKYSPFAVIQSRFCLWLAPFLASFSLLFSKHTNHHENSQLPASCWEHLARAFVFGSNFAGLSMKHLCFDSLTPSMSACWRAKEWHRDTCSTWTVNIHYFCMHAHISRCLSVCARRMI